MARARMEDSNPDRPLHQGRRARYKQPERSAVGICTKYTLFFENFFLVIVGLGMTALGTYILVIKDKVVHDAIDFFLDPACDMVLAGSIIFIMGFLGCSGALREITCFLKLYYFILCLILLAELGIAILMFVSYYVPSVKSTIFPEDTFQKAITNYRSDVDMKNLIDTLQQDLQCCGLSDSEEGYLNWNDNMYFNCSETNQSPERCSVPYSCCIRSEGDVINYQCGANMFIEKNGEIKGNTKNIHLIHKDGCLKALGTWINDHALIVGGILLGVLLPQVFIVVLTRNLIDMIAAQKSKWRYE